MQEYLDLIEELGDYFGKNIGDRQAMLWISVIKEKYSVDTLKAAIRKLSIEFKKMPTLADVLEVCQAIEPFLEVEIYDCATCYGSGMRLVDKRVKIGDETHIATYAYRCSCKNGERYPNVPYLTEDTYVIRKRYSDKETSPLTAVNAVKSLIEKTKIGGQNAEL